MSEPLPVLRCESRRPPAFERGFLAWSLALVLIGAAALDAFWMAPPGPRRLPAPAVQLVPVRCTATPRPARERKVEDVRLMTPTQAAR